MIQKIKDLIQAYKERRNIAREEEAKYYAKQYCCMDDIFCVPCIMVGGVPLYKVTDNKTDLTEFNVNIKDAEIVINAIRVKYSLNRLKED